MSMTNGFMPIVPTTGMFKNIFAIRWKNICSNYNYGTMFVVLNDAKIVCISAKHVLPVLITGGEVEVLINSQWNSLEIEHIYDKDNLNYDVIGFEPKNKTQLGSVVSYEVSDGMHNLIPGSPAMYMGYPASWLEGSNKYLDFYSNDMAFKPGYPMPVTKQTYISYNHVIDEIPNIYLGGTANKGFSGAPVYAYRLDSEGEAQLTLVVCGVIVSHKFDLTKVYDNNRVARDDVRSTSYADVSIAQPPSLLFT